MIPTIGVMIGAYIITRMVELTARDDLPKRVFFFAIVTMIITVVGMADLFLVGLGGASPNGPNLPFP